MERLEVDVYPAKHFVTTEDKLRAAIRDIEQELEERLQELEAEGKLLEGARLRQRTMQTSRCSGTGCTRGVETTRCFNRRPGEQRPTLLDYFWTISCSSSTSRTSRSPSAACTLGTAAKGCAGGARFRLPSARDNRPLTFSEFERMIPQARCLATPGPYEQEHSEQVVEQVIRPTGLIDPAISVRPPGVRSTTFLERSTLASRRAASPGYDAHQAHGRGSADYFKEMGIRTHYLHSEIDTLERVEILRDLRLGVHDVVVGINPARGSRFARGLVGGRA